MKRHLSREFLLLLGLFITWRISLFVIAYLAPSFIPQFGAKFPYFNERLISTGLPAYVWSFGNFDGVHYLGIAKDAYAYQFTQAFFPLYPMLFGFLSRFTGVDLLISGLLLANISFLAGLIVFYRLTSEVLDKKTAIWSCTFLLFFPTSFYFGSVYTEGLFFFLTTLSFYLFYKKKVLVASAIGMAASLTRLVGVFLSVSLQSPKRLTLLPLIFVPLGLISYMVYLKFKFDNALYFLTSQTVFGQERSTAGMVLLPQVIYRWIKQILTTNNLTLFNSTYELMSLVFVIIMLVIAWRTTKKEWVTFSALAIITPTLTGSLASMPRYILVAFPLFVVLGQIKSLYLKILTLVIFIILLIISTALFTRGYWIA